MGRGSGKPFSFFVPLPPGTELPEVEDEPPAEAAAPDAQGWYTASVEQVGREVAVAGVERRWREFVAGWPSQPRPAGAGAWEDRDFPPKASSVDGRGGGSTEEEECRCGTTAAVRTVQKDGKNSGRLFLCCPVPRGAAGRCDFFKWTSRQELPHSEQARTLEWRWFGGADRQGRHCHSASPCCRLNIRWQGILVNDTEMVAAQNGSAEWPRPRPLGHVTV
jgi:hypothetical protein